VTNNVCFNNSNGYEHTLVDHTSLCLNPVELVGVIRLVTTGQVVLKRTVQVSITWWWTQPQRHFYVVDGDVASPALAASSVETNLRIVVNISLPTKCAFIQEVSFLI